MKKLLFLTLLSFGAPSLFAQSITGISPDKGEAGQTLPIIISGQNTSFTGGNNTFLQLRQGPSVIGQSGNSGFTNISVVNSSSISANLSLPGSSTLGFYDLWVSSGSSTLQKLMAFEVISPSPTPKVTISPVGAQPNRTINATFTVTGSSFKTTAQKIEKVWLSLGTQVIEVVNNVQVLSANSFSANVVIPANSAQGNWDVSVYTDDKKLYTSKAAFQITNTFSRNEYNNAAFELYPNPASEKVLVTFEGTYPQMEVKIFDLTGKSISNFTYKRNFEENKMEVLTETLPTGVYMMQFIANNQIIAVKKLVRK